MNRPILEAEIAGAWAYERLHVPALFVRPTRRPEEVGG